MSKFLSLAMLAVLAVCLQRCEGTICMDCEDMNCVEPDCEYGTILDECDCCKVCTKGLDELCEGLMENYGKCSEGLYCEKPVCKKGKTSCASLPGYCKPEQ
ncbi:single insulin-like growth factor-binding domain protein-2 [Asterias rubens]|uniref:single insulin-like growth factor-binding domain protein-2 n=1 Tax=Asterias rubens TaxID=7604 RepID=UPI001455C6D0|nr:single insulin-like growth factor-binding domain protein-2 [Asterias rubens]